MRPGTIVDDARATIVNLAAGVVVLIVLRATRCALSGPLFLSKGVCAQSGNVRSMGSTPEKLNGLGASLKTLTFPPPPVKRNRSSNSETTMKLESSVHNS